MHPTRIEAPYNGQSFFIDIANGKMELQSVISQTTRTDF